MNLDFDSEQDMINKLRVGLSLQPVSLLHENLSIERNQIRRDSVMACHVIAVFYFQTLVEINLNK